MNEDKMKAAEKAAKHFLDSASEMKIALQCNAFAFCGSPQSGALRRASMELTRALALLRTPG
jgi:hypothetical protein